MIQYSLICENRHKFIAWFKSAKVFDEQIVNDVVTCPVCATNKVNKALMAPSVSRARHKQSDQEQKDTPAYPPSRQSGAKAPNNQDRDQAKISLSAGHPDQAKLARALRTLHDQIISQADYVGDKFAREARKIHDCEVEPHGIYGEATTEEAASLLEDGIEFMPLPTLPEEQN
ncbi:FIG004851: hypothetical protein [hydrothermal vent metagenome]|uniref:DUF1178 family protein n=1 Tax=hydrothermal vent metagenome TaxID=652676 RepID=A0A3B0TDC4_9ZZZZ